MLCLPSNQRTLLTESQLWKWNLVLESNCEAMEPFYVISKSSATMSSALSIASGLTTCYHVQLRVTKAFDSAPAGHTWKGGHNNWKSFRIVMRGVERSRRRCRVSCAPDSDSRFLVRNIGSDQPNLPSLRGRRIGVTLLWEGKTLTCPSTAITSHCVGRP